jgi:hypothetical protein
VWAPGTGCLAGLAGWLGLGAPGQLPGLAALIAACWLVIPLAVLLVVFGGAAAAYAAVPPAWRVWWRGGLSRGVQPSARIPAWLHRAVMIADGGACVFCGSCERPQPDHVKPWRQGGHTALGNLVVLCAAHNQYKSDYWQTRSGRVIYSPFTDPAKEARASAILAAERRRRLSPWRWVRAAHGLRWI